MRPLSIFFAFALLTLTSILAFAPNAEATIVVEQSLEQLTKSSEIIALGSVIGTRSYWTEGQTRVILTEVTVLVEKALKGSTKQQTLTFIVRGGRVDRLAQRIAGEPSFHKGERALVFLSQNGRKYLGVKGMSQGKYSVMTRAEDGVEVALSSTADLSLAVIGRISDPTKPEGFREEVKLLKEPAPGQVVPLQTLIKEIEKHTQATPTP